MSQATGPILPLAAGAVIQGRYELRRVLGQGGMGSVWVAWHQGLQIEVALKFITDAPPGEQEDLLARFTREASAVARIKSPHVVTVLDHGFDEEHQVPFLAMELLTGESLGDRIDRERQLPIADTVNIVRQVLRGLAKAHEAQVVHRDLKPDNLFLCRDDELLVKILDFGIAKTGFDLELKGASSAPTQPGTLMGTPYYMSPEQTLGNKVVDHRSDLYAIGVVAYHCLAGVPPFDSTGLGELLMMINSDEAPRLRTYRPDVPEPLEQWFVKALAKAPGARFQDAKQMSAALGQAFEQSFGALPGRFSEATGQYEPLTFGSASGEGVRLPPKTPPSGPVSFGGPVKGGVAGMLLPQAQPGAAETPPVTPLSVPQIEGGPRSGLLQPPVATLRGTSTTDFSIPPPPSTAGAWFRRFIVAVVVACCGAFAAWLAFSDGTIPKVTLGGTAPSASAAVSAAASAPSVASSAPQVASARPLIKNGTPSPVGKKPTKK
jgi:serine/threonine-protein kinase